MKKLLLILLLSATFAFARGSHSGSHSSSHNARHSSRSSASTKNSTGKSIHVRGYSRKDGKHVRAYDRRPAGARSSTTHSKAARTYQKHRALRRTNAYPSTQRDKHGKIKRSRTARATFEHEHRCPSTGKTSGPCPGYIVDHIKPLECGGADAPSNMQWQTVADAKAKDKTERYCR